MFIFLFFSLFFYFNKGGRVCESACSSDNGPFYDALTAEDDQTNAHAHSASAAALASVLPNIYSYDNSSSYEPLCATKMANNSIEKIVNPLGTVTTINSCLSDVKTDILDEVVSQLAKEDTIIHENCDESLFRPVVAIFCDEKTLLRKEEEGRNNSEQYQAPEFISSKLVVPVIEKEINDELSKREREKTSSVSILKTKVTKNKLKEQTDFECITIVNKKPKDSRQTKAEGANVGQENNSEKLIEQTILSYSPTKPNTEVICEKYEVGHTKSTSALKETSGEVEVTQKIKTKKEIQILGKPSKILQEQNKDMQTEVGVSQKKIQEIKLKHQDDKNSNVNNKKNGAKVKTTKSEVETQKSLHGKLDENEKINYQTKPVKDIETQKYDSEVKKLDQKNLPKTKSEPNIILTADISNKTKTATKEKLKKTKDSIKNNKFGSTQALHELQTTRVFDAESKSQCIEVRSNEPNDEVKSLRNSKNENEVQKNNSEINNFKKLNEKQFGQSKEQISESHYHDDENRENELKKGNIIDVKQDSESFTTTKSKIDGKEVKKTSNCIENPTEVISNTENNLIEPKGETEKPQNENDKNFSQINKITIETATEQTDAPVKKLINSDSLNKDGNDCTKMKQSDLSEVKSKSMAAEKTSPANAELSKVTLVDVKANTKSFETKNRPPNINPTSQKRKGKESSKSEVMASNTNISPLFKNNECNKKCHVKEESANEDEKHANSETSENEFVENIATFCRKPIEDTRSPILLPVSAWKTLSGADMINKNLNKKDCGLNKSSLLVSDSEMKASDKLLPDIPTPADLDKQTNLEELLVLKSLDPLPPLPDLEPLKLLTENKSSFPRDVSLITFESPSIENISFKRKITPAPRGFTEQNLILALCGSLHFENEQIEKSETSPTFSSNHSSSAFEETSLADYKSLTENDDPYISFEQSSQDTNTTNTNNEKFFSSTNSSGSEEIVKAEEKKMTRKQKRKRQQHQVKDFQKEPNLQQEIVDEELLPLIALTESQVYSAANHFNVGLPESSSNKITRSSVAQLHLYSTTTDSEGPLPTTTSDDNVFPIPVHVSHNTHKIKTKKLEHKINLIAAIEAATSSSAEESGVEIGAQTTNDNDESLAAEGNIISTSSLPIPIASTSQTSVGVIKKKTKRRKR